MLFQTLAVQGGIVSEEEWMVSVSGVLGVDPSFVEESGDVPVDDLDSVDLGDKAKGSN